MNKIIALVIVGAIAFGAWKFWPDIKDKVAGEKDDEQKSEEKSDNPPDPGPNPPVNPNPPVAPPLNPMGTPPVAPPVVNSGQNPAAAPMIPVSDAPVDVTLTLKIFPNPARDNELIYQFSAPEGFPTVAWLYRVITPDQNLPWKIANPGPGQNRFNFTSMRNINVDAVIEILLDPKAQLPELMPFCGVNGEYLAGPYAREHEQRTVIHAAAKVRPAALRFTPRQPEAKIQVGAAPKRSKI